VVNDPTTASRTAAVTEGASSGNVMRRSRCQPPIPSMAAASYSAGSMARRPPMNTRVEKPAFCQICTKMTSGIAQ
jgi:hypothetical protein